MYKFFQSELGNWKVGNKLQLVNFGILKTKNLEKISQNRFGNGILNQKAHNK